MTRFRLLKPLALFATVFGGLACVIWGLSLLAGYGSVPAPDAAAPVLDDGQVSTAQRIRNMPREPVSLHSDRSVEPSAQAPMLDALVERGALPPLKERLPDNPVVLRGVDGVGSYGGQWSRVATGPSDVAVIGWRLSYHAPLRWSPMGEPIVPHVAEAFEASADQRVFTIRLRAGHRWSDGEPFTTDDVMYWWEREVHDDAVGPMSPPAWMMNGGRPPRLEQVDQQTFRVIYDRPNSLFKYRLASFGYQMFESPRHYLGGYHPNGGDPELIAAALEAYQLPDARSLYGFQKDRTNPLHPRLWPWVYRSFRSNPPHTFVRNPYYFAVDEAGQQLPYIDSVWFDQRRSEQIPLEVANGKVTMQARNLSFDDVTEYMTRRATSGIDVKFWDASDGTAWIIQPNLNRRADDLAGRWKAQYLGDARFRRALSLAINRGRIIESEYSGLVEPMQVSPGASSPFRNEAAAKLYTEHDPQRAERLLDELGFKRPSPGVMRRAPDGTTLTFFLDYTAFTGRGPADFVVEDWTRVGINVIAQERARRLFSLRLRSREADFVVWTGNSDYFPLVEPRYYMPTNNQSYWAPAWGIWAQHGGAEGLTVEDGRAIAPPPDHPVRRSIDLFRQVRQAGSRQEQVALFHQMQQLAAEQVYTINIAEAPPQVLVTDERLRNVPDNALFGYFYASPGNAAPEMFYLEGEEPDAAVSAVLASSLVEPTLRPGGQQVNGTSSNIGLIAGRLLLIVLLGVLVVAGLRYRFIGGRLLLMIPTLGVLSLLIFTIIQAPPGDYLTTRLMELEEQGHASAHEQVEELRQTFHLDEPFLSQYARWVGLTWFTTFDASDTGLLQGNLGRSMATSQPVNFVVGDRILLTILISGGTILLTWSLALPIGVYSAVRQYSPGDYALTLAGFIGMSIPNFLLALVLMTLAGVSGLFSAEYAGQTTWDFGKVIDLLKHVWVPVLVLGVSGTASMIRIMRANLLDELKKPYVVTARAKGVRPMKLLVKYPVRMALNPFVSSIGGLFPQLVSGGAVVAMVLALPTVGPLLLEALLLEDMYLAGSMLMVLSLLGIIGTLVSDLLLLWLDPRIRFEGGTR